MPVLKYKTGTGQFTPITNYTVQPIVPVQTTGTSTTDIMSQNAVTQALNAKVAGPASSTNNHIATFNGDTGKLVQDSGKTITTAKPIASSDDNSIPTSKAVYEAIPTSLPANGGNADTVDNFHFMTISQSDYDNLTPKDSNTFYIIS